MDDAEDPRGASREIATDGPIVLVSSVVAMAFVGLYLLALGVQPPAHADTARDMLLARDGLLSGVYHGCRAAFGDFVQGALWERILGAAYAAGVDPNRQYALLTALLLPATGMLHAVAARNFGTRVARFGTACYVPLSVVAMGYPNLWNPALGQAGPALAWVCLVWTVRGGGATAAAGVGLGLAYAVEAHMGSVLMIPVAIGLIGCAADRPLRSLATTTSVLAFVSLWASFESFETNLAALGDAAWYLPSLPLFLLLARRPLGRARAAFRARALGDRIRSLPALAFAAFAAEIVLASVLARRPLISPQYWTAALPALATVLGLALGGGPPSSRRFSGCARWTLPALLLGFPLALATAWRVGVQGGAAGMPAYGMNDARLVARHLAARGYAYPDAQRHLRGADSLELITSLAPFAESPLSTPERALPDLRVLAFDPDHAPHLALPAGASRVALDRGREAWLLPIEPWIGLAPSRVCASVGGPPGRTACAPVRSASQPYGAHFADMAYPALGDVGRLYRAVQAATGARGELRWELPITVRGDDAERHVELAGIFGTPWRIAAVEGVGHRGALPARHVVIDRSMGTSGTLVVTTSSPSNRWYPPDFLETHPEETELRRVARSLPPLGPCVCRLRGTCPP